MNGSFRKDLRALIKEIALQNKTRKVALSYVFLTDEELLEINRTHLDHDYYTDIITFDMGSSKQEIWGELYISKDRIKDHAHTYGVSEEEEFIRVFSHGFLHLLGFNDKSEVEAAQMRKEEERCLSLWESLKIVSRETLKI